MTYDKRTQQQRDFDGAIRGWAFTEPSRLVDQLPRYQALLDDIRPRDEARATTLETIRTIAEGAKA